MKEEKTLIHYYPVYHITDKNGKTEYNYTKISIEIPNTESTMAREQKQKIHEALETHLKQTHTNAKPHIIDIHYNERAAKSQTTTAQGIHDTQ